MKRKGRIITGIISFALMASLLAFGVYAATSASLSVSTTVSFSVSDMGISLVSGQAYINNSADLTTPTAQGTALTAWNSYSDANTPASPNTTASRTWAIGNIAPTDTDPYVIITFKMRNMYGGNIYITPTFPSSSTLSTAGFTFDSHTYKVGSNAAANFTSGTKVGPIAVGTSTDIDITFIFHRTGSFTGASLSLTADTYKYAITRS